MSTAIQRAFSGGEITPGLYARIDVAKYITGLRTCRNNIVLKHGGVYNRPGTGFISEVKDSSKTIKYVPFIYNSEQTYVLEFGNLYMRVIRNGIPQYDLTLTITGITNASQAVLSYTGTDPTNGQEIYISTVVGPMATFVNGRNFKIANVNSGANTLELLYLDGTPVDSTAFGLYTSAGTAKRVYEIATPYLEADLPYVKYSQSADVITLTHRSYKVQRLARTGHTSWTMTDEVFAPTQTAPTSPANTGGGPGSAASWVITAIGEDTYEESLPTAATTSAVAPTSGSPLTVSWAAAADALEYNVYKALNGVYGFIGVARGTSFVDNGIDPDTDITPPDSRDPFATPNNYPGVSGYYQQRQLFANTFLENEKVFTTKSGAFRNMTISSPLQDDDAVTFTLAGVKVNAVEHILDLDGLIIFTTGAEVQILGDSNGILRPGQVNPRNKSYWGSSHIPPIVIGNTALFVQARVTLIRDLYNDSIEGFKGNDLTVYSSHLFEDYTIQDWTYQQIPNSNAWAVRNDGTLLGLTYIREQQFLAWHRHDTNGIIENVVSVPEGTEDALYICVKRTINGETKRYNERFKARRFTDIVDAAFMDSSLSYDGRNVGSTTMTMSGSGWTTDDTLTMTASASFFTADDVGNQIFMYDDDENLIRFTITGFTSDLIVTGFPSATVPVSLQSLPRTTWSKAIKSLKGLWHLEGQDVSIFGDGFVVSNPNNSAYDVITVENGTAELAKPYAVIHAGEPFTSDLETLDMDYQQTETMIDKQKLISEVIVYVRDSRGFWAGTSAPVSDSDFTDQLKETKLRNAESMNDPISLKTEAIPLKLTSKWDSNGRVFIRNTDPIPLEILAVAPKGFIPAFAKGA